MSDRTIIPPQGVVTLLFTDVEGSTSRWNRFPEQYDAAIQLHERLVREAIAAWHGFEVKTAGDSFMVAFERATDAVQCALQIQTALAKANEEPLFQSVEGLRVRIGLHTGEPNFRDRDYFGPTVNRAARIMDAGHGGMTLLSEQTARIIGNALGETLTLRDEGQHRLKDLGQPERLYRLMDVNSRSRDYPRLRTLEAISHNFPNQLTNFIGREREKTELRKLLCEPDARLVTLTGPGGTGKTRLAIQVAADQLQDFPGGVWLVDLASVRDTALVPTNVALALRIEIPPERDPRLQVMDYLRSRKALLLLDNFEQVADAAPFVSEMLRECANLTCLITSRELLRVSGEREFVVQPLSIPPTDKEDNHWTQYESVQLFVERCQAFKPDFVLTDENAPVVGDICRRLDGIPLVIELAAARVRGMTPQQVLQRLSRRLDLLASSQRDLPERQRTLRGAMDWSYDLLTEDEREVFAEMAVFSGGFFIEAAENVSDNFMAFDCVFSLRDKSLLKTDEVNGSIRYYMLETIREYALEKLQKSDKLATLKTKHADYFLNLAQEWDKKLISSERAEAMQVFTVDIQNMRDGMDYASQKDDHLSVAQYGIALCRFLRNRGLYDECESRLILAEEAAHAENDDHSEARILNQRGLVAWTQSELPKARDLFEQSLALHRKLNEEDRIAATLGNLGIVAYDQARFAEARQYWEESLEISVRLKNARWGASTLMNLGILAGMRGDYTEAERCFQESKAAQEKIGNQVSVAFVLYNSAEIFRRQKKYDDALARLREAQQQFQSLGEKSGLTEATVEVARVLLEAGRLEEAAPEIEASLLLARETGQRRREMYALDLQARLLARQGSWTEARAAFRAAEKIARTIGDPKTIAELLWHCGESLPSQERHTDAYLLLSVAARELKALELAPDCAEVHTLLEGLREKLGSEVEGLDEMSISLLPEGLFDRL